MSDEPDNYVMKKVSESASVESSDYNEVYVEGKSVEEVKELFDHALKN